MPILWDTEKWVRKRVLMGGTGVGVQQASFSPDGSMILSTFTDGSMLIWNTDSFNLEWKITLQINISPATNYVSTNGHVLRSSYFAMSTDGEIVAYGGITSSLFVWNLTEKKLLHEVIIPVFQDKYINQIEFIGDTKVVALSSSTGDVILIDTVDAKYVGQLQDAPSKTFAFTYDGQIFASITSKNRALLTYTPTRDLVEEMVGVSEELEAIVSAKVRSTSPEPIVHAPTFDASKPREFAKTQKIKFTPSSLANGSIGGKVSGEDGRVVMIETGDRKTLYDLVEERKGQFRLMSKRLNHYLTHFGCFPDKYRPLIWRFLLHLPENRDSYESLMSKSTHPALKGFREKFPLKSERLARSLERVISGLAYWSPVFENLDYLPNMIFPFVKLLVNDTFSCFELIMTILLNYCQKWWEYYPNPPIECMDILEDLLAIHDRDLLAHLTAHKITSQVYGWLMMQTFFSEVLTAKEWLVAWDHILASKSPGFLYYFAAAYCIYFRKALMNLTRLDDFKYFFTRPNPCKIEKIVAMAQNIQRSTPASFSANSYFKPFEPVSKGDYPVFNAFPSFIVNYQTKLRDKIRKEEEEYMIKKKVTEEISRLQDELRRDKRAWETTDWKMTEMVEKWWESMVQEESSHAERRFRLNALEKTKRAQALHQIGDARQEMIDNHNKGTQRHVNLMSKAVGVNRRLLERDVDEAMMNTRFSEIENEWMQRKEDLNNVRQNLVQLEKMRLERLLKNIRKVGVSKDELLQELEKKGVQLDNRVQGVENALGTQDI